MSQEIRAERERDSSGVLEETYSSLFLAHQHITDPQIIINRNTGTLIGCQPPPPQRAFVEDVKFEDLVRVSQMGQV